MNLFTGLLDGARKTKYSRFATGRSQKMGWGGRTVVSSDKMRYIEEPTQGGVACARLRV